MNANVIIYYRVSSNEQTLGASLDVQEERLRKYCNQMGYNIIDNIPYREDESAKTFEKRPVIQGIMNYIRKNKGRVNKLLFLQWDRYSRDIISASENLKELLKSGVEPNAIEAPLDFNSDTWPLLLEYRHNATTSKGQKIQWTVFMEHWQKENVLIKHQEGYKNVRISKHETHVEIDTNTAPFIQAMFKEVAKDIETPCYIRRKFARKGYNIPESSFLEMLRNKFYIGKIRVPAYKGEPEYYVNGEHEAIIDEETFYKVQEILDGKRKKTPKLSKAINPDLYLRKFLICPVCGCALTGATSSGNGGKYTYYFCCNNQKHIRVRSENVNEEFARYTAQLKPNKTVLDLYNEILKDLQSERKGESKKEVAALQNELSTVQKRINSIEDKYLDGDLTKEEYNRMLERYTKEASTIQQQVEMRENPNRSNIEPKLNYSINLINNIDSYIRNASVGVKIKLISSMFPEKIEFDGKTYRTNSYNKVLGQRKILRGISDKILSLCETNESSAIMETNGYRLLLPEGTLDYFNISDVKESSSEIVIYLEEKNELPGEYSTVKVESKGFYDPVVVRDFPIRGKNLFLNIRRRRWILKDDGRYVSRNWKLVAEGSRMTHEFASFLKELY